MIPPLLTPEAVQGVRLLLLDVDGVLTDGRLYFGRDGAAHKAFHVRDGLGIALLHRAGIETGIISGRDDAYVRERADELGMTIIRIGEPSKGHVLEEVLRERHLPREVVAYVGDDVNDVPALTRVGIPIAVADAHPDVFPCVRFVTRARGGRGAVREVADAILGVGRAGAGEGA